MITKLRRNESFALNWTHGMDDGSGRSTIWVHPGVELEFVFYGNRRPERNREWIELLLEAANSAEGLRMIPEPEPEHAAVGRLHLVAHRRRGPRRVHRSARGNGRLPPASEPTSPSAAVRSEAIVPARGATNNPARGDSPTRARARPGGELGKVGM